MIYPMFLLIVFTFCYGGFMAYGRVSAAKKGEVNGHYFKTMSGSELPERLQLTTRHFANLLETPPLFYIAGAMIIATGLETALTISVAWAYLIFRGIHSYIHNTYNHPLHRMAAYVGSLLCILALWFYLMIEL